MWESRRQNTVAYVAKVSTSRLTNISSAIWWYILRKGTEMNEDGRREIHPYVNHFIVYVIIWHKNKTIKINEILSA